MRLTGPDMYNDAPFRASGPELPMTHSEKSKRRPGPAWLFSVLLALGFAGTAAAADDGHYWRIQTSVLTRHFHPDPIHNNHNHLVGLEWWLENDWHAGAAFFSNSYRQPTQYVYVGKAWPVGQSDHFYVRVTAGLIHGYKDAHKNKIPFNHFGIAPAILPSLGVKYGHLFAEIQMLGVAGGMVTAGFSFGGH